MCWRKILDTDSDLHLQYNIFYCRYTSKLVQLWNICHRIWTYTSDVLTRFPWDRLGSCIILSYCTPVAWWMTYAYRHVQYIYYVCQTEYISLQYYEHTVLVPHRSHTSDMTYAYACCMYLYVVWYRWYSEYDIPQSTLNPQPRFCIKQIFLRSCPCEHFVACAWRVEM